MTRGLRILLATLFLSPPAAAQQDTSRIDAPRPFPVLPTALVPFRLSADLCLNNNLPSVSLRVYNVLAQPVAVLRLRTARSEPIEALRLPCGRYVARWDGTIDNGARIAPPGLYYLHLIADGRRRSLQLIVPQT